jgi:class 3 adenylate cyclase
VYQPDTRYTKVGDAAIAYQVVGDGPVDLVYVPGMASNIDLMWEWPLFAAMLERLASFSRLIAFDARGSGISDPLSFEAQPTWEHWIEDLRAVMNAAGSVRASFLAQYDGVPRALLFAATYPERTSALVLWNAYARPLEAVDQEGVPMDTWISTLGDLWGTDELVRVLQPTFAQDPENLRWAKKYLRGSATPTRAEANYRYQLRLDAADALPLVQAPTLVLQRQDSVASPAAEARFVAENIGGARWAEFAGSGVNIFSEGMDEIVGEIEEFLTGRKLAIQTDRQLSSVLFTDIVGSTQTAASLGDRRWKELLAQHDRLSRQEVERVRGRFVSSTGDGIVATFDGPSRAIRCALELGRVLHPTGLRIRAGIHTGEIELREGDDIGGIAVHIAARVMGEAAPGEVVCSRTVKDLVVGSEFAFVDRGAFELKGVPDEWLLYAVRHT